MVLKIPKNRFYNLRYHVGGDRKGSGIWRGGMEKNGKRNSMGVEEIYLFLSTPLLLF